MKKIAILLLSFSSTTAFAQRGFFLQPEVGIGGANTREPYPASWNVFYGNPGRAGNVQSLAAQLLAGYSFDSWEIVSGIALLQSGYLRDDMGIDEKYYTHILVPVIAAYRIRLGDRFFLVPGAGLDLSYNPGVKIVYPYNGHRYSYTWTKDEFDEVHRQLSFWGTAQVVCGYKVSDRLSVIAGPTANYMPLPLSNLNLITLVGNITTPTCLIPA
jgi:hypothetical protein